MNDPGYQDLLELSWRRKLTPEEEARLQAALAAQPAPRAEWPAEAALGAALRSLPAAPLASNFTAQVMQVVAAEEARRARRSRLAACWQDWLKPFLPRVAWVGLALVLGVTGMREYQAQHRTRLARSLAQVSAVLVLPSPEALQDFEAIRQMRQLPAVSDEALLAALQ